MPKKSLKGGTWPFDIFSKPKDPNAPTPQQSGPTSWFRNPFNKTAPPPPDETVPATVQPQVSGGKRRTKRKSQTTKNKNKSRKRR